MDTLLVCCVGNVSFSPVFAAIHDAEAAARGLDARILTAGLTNRTELPATYDFVLAAADRALADLPAARAALRAHRPTPLKHIPRASVRGVLYLHEADRKRRHLVDDAKVLGGWAPGTPVLHVGLDDPGYRLWMEQGQPGPDSAAAAPVVEAYEGEIRAVRALALELLTREASGDPTFTVTAAAEMPAPGPPPELATIAVHVAPVPEATRKVPRETPSTPILRPDFRAVPKSTSTPSVGVRRPLSVESLVAPTPAPFVPPTETPSTPKVRRIVQLKAPPPPPPPPEPEPKPRKRKTESSSGTAAAVTATGTIKAEREAKVTPKPAPKAPKLEGPAGEALEDLRAWLRAALPLSRPTLVRYGLWERVNQHLGGWETAVAATGVTPAEPLWKLPRDPELAFDILIEALPDETVARLTEESIAKVRTRRKQTNGPSPEEQLTRRLVATEQLGSVPDAEIAAHLGLEVEDVARVREAEKLPAR